MTRRACEHCLQYRGHAQGCPFETLYMKECSACGHEFGEDEVKTCEECDQHYCFGCWNDEDVSCPASSTAGNIIWDAVKKAMEE